MPFNMKALGWLLLITVAWYVTNLIVYITGEIQRQYMSLARHSFGALAYALAYAGTALELMSPPGPRCKSPHGGIFESNPSRLSDRGFREYQTCLGRFDGYVNQDGFNVKLYFAVVLGVPAVIILQRVIIFLAYCVVGNRPQDLEKALALAHQDGIAFAEASCRSTVKELELKIADLEGQAMICMEQHDYKTAYKAERLEVEKRNLVADLTRVRRELDQVNTHCGNLIQRDRNLESGKIERLQSRHLALEKSFQQRHNLDLSVQDRLRKELEDALDASRALAQRNEGVVKERNQLRLWKSRYQEAKGAIDAETMKHQSAIMSYEKDLVEVNSRREHAETALRDLERSEASRPSVGTVAEILAEVKELRHFREIHVGMDRLYAEEFDDLKQFKESAVKEGMSMEAQLEELRRGPSPARVR